jgi:hypothetical protein
MSVAGKWRIIEMPGYPADYPDLVEPAYILFENKGGGEFAFGACTGHIWEASNANAASIDFSWDGSDEMDEVSGDGDAELQHDGSLRGEIRYRSGDELPFIAKRWTSSTAC